jgi:hypothetical protein
MRNFLRKLPNLIALVIFPLAALGVVRAARADSNTFGFEAIHSLDDMQRFIVSHFSLGSPQQSLRKIFVAEGKATLKPHPTQAGVEKYLYDINLCSYYVWRWNISADYDPAQKKDAKVIAAGANGKKASVFKMMRPRPEASKGEKELASVVVDADSDLRTIDDQILIGGGPSQPDPVDMGKLIVYQNVEPWRSIFDLDSADRIVSYSGDCAKVDELYAQAKRNAPSGQTKDGPPAPK